MGRPILRTEEQAGDIVVKDIMCGDEAAAARSMLQISYPVRSLAYRSESTIPAMSQQPPTILACVRSAANLRPLSLPVDIDGKRYREEMG